MRIPCQAYYSVLARLDSLLSRRNGEKLLSKPQVCNLSLLVFGLFASGCCRLTHIAGRVPVAAGISAALERLERFLKNHAINPASAYEPVARLLLTRLQGGRVRLILDASQINGKVFMLFVAVAYRGRALPLAWCMLDKESVSTSSVEQIRLLNRVARLMSDGTQVTLLGDREYGTVALIDYCLERGWDFCLRAKKSRAVVLADGRRMRLGSLSLSRGERLYFCGITLPKLKSQATIATMATMATIQLACAWSSVDADDEPWYLLTNLPAGARVFSLYRTRFWIDEMFRDFKEQGFRLECTHVRDPERISRMLLGLCIAYVWLLNAGIWVSKRSMRSRVDRRSKRQLSWFQIGMRYLQHLLALSRRVPCCLQPYI